MRLLNYNRPVFINENHTETHYVAISHLAFAHFSHKILALYTCISPPHNSHFTHTCFRITLTLLVHQHT